MTSMLPSTSGRASCLPSRRQALVLPTLQRARQTRGFVPCSAATGYRVEAQIKVSPEVSCEVEKTSWNSRKLFASVPIGAPVELVWGCLTDYEGLGNFIPSLVENKCLQRKRNGALLYQVGAQDLAAGVKFSAACTLDCTEHVGGVPRAQCSTSGDGSDGLFPYPRCLSRSSSSSSTSSLASVSSIASASGSMDDLSYGNGAGSGIVRDITFKLVEGDFKAFRGVWRMQQGEAGQPGTMLSYSLYVQPQSWLPVGLIEGRIKREVLRNLAAVRKHAEGLQMKRSMVSASSD